MAEEDPNKHKEITREELRRRMTRKTKVNESKVMKVDSSAATSLKHSPFLLYEI